MLPRQQHSRCHSVSFAMYVSGAKLKNTAPIVLEIFLIKCCTVSVETTYDVITLLICIIQKRIKRRVKTANFKINAGGVLFEVPAVFN